MMKIAKFCLMLYLATNRLMMTRWWLINMQQKKSEKQLANEKSERIMNGVAYW